MRTLLCIALLALPAAAGDLLISSRFTDEVLRYDLGTGAFVGVFASGGGLQNPIGLSYGPDGHLYVASAANDQILRFDGATGVFLDVFAQGPELQAPRQIQFGPDGDLFVANAGTDQVLRYSGADGSLRGVFVASKNLDGPNGITFGPGGDLYVASVLTNRVKRYDGRTGALLGDFAKVQLALPHDVSFGPDGQLYVTNAGSTRITRYDRASGQYVDDFTVDPALSAPLGMLWLPDGNLLVVNQGGDEVRVYDWSTGALATVLVTPGSGGLDGPLYAATMPDPGPALQLAPGIAQATNHLVVSGAAPGAVLTIGIDRRGQPDPDAADAPLLGPFFADEGGRLVVRQRIAALPGTRLVLQSVDAPRHSLSPVTTVTLH